MTNTPRGLFLSAPTACSYKSLSLALKWSWIPQITTAGLASYGLLLARQLAAGFVLAVFLLVYWKRLKLKTTRRFFQRSGSPIPSFGRPLPVRTRWRVRRGVLHSMVLLAILCGAAASEAASDKSLEDLLEQVPDNYSAARDSVTKRLKAYRRWSESYRATAIRDLNVRYDRAVRTLGPVSHQAIHVKTTFDWLNGTAGPPNDKTAVAWTVNFVEAIVSQQEVVWKPLAILIRDLNKTGNLSEAALLHHAFLGLEAAPRPNGQLLMKRTFRGYRISPDGKKMRRMQFKVSHGDDSQWSGAVELDYGYRTHPVHHLSGNSSGPYLIAQTGATKSFGSRGDRAWSYSASLFGRSLVGRYSGRNSKGRLETGLFMLHSK